MWRSNQINAVKSLIAKYDLSLETSLLPLWKFSWYSGILLDWCRPMPNQSRLSVILRYIFITITIFCFSFFLFTYGWITLTTAWRINSIHEIIPNFISLVPISLSSITMIDYLIHRNNYLGFFIKWGRFEKKINFAKVSQKDNQSVKRFRLVVYGLYLLQAVVIISSFVYLVLFQSYDNSSSEKGQPTYLLLLNYPAFKEILVYPILELIQLLVVSMAFFLTTMVDLVSAFFYYHASIVLKKLKQETETAFTIVDTVKENGDPRLFLRPTTAPPMKFVEVIYGIWSRYEKLRGLVAKADALFGPSMILNHSLMFFMLCTVGYAVLRNFKIVMADPEQTLYFLVFIMFSFRFVWTVLFMSKLASSAKILRISVVSLQSRHWFSLQASDKIILQNFIKQMDLDALAACPCDFYRVTPIIIINVSTLIISYTIVLLQAK